VWNEDPESNLPMDLPVLVLFFVTWNVPRRAAKENARNNSSSILSRDKWCSFIHSFYAAAPELFVCLEGPSECPSERAFGWAHFIEHTSRSVARGAWKLSWQ
jgi:hypothetical protein